MNDHPSSNINPRSADEGVRSLRKGVRLAWVQLSHLTLGQAEQILRESSSDTHEGFLQLFATLAGLAGAETARAFSLVGSEVRSHIVGEDYMPDWTPFFTALKHERTTRAITEEMTLRDLSELLWEMHTAQDLPAAPRSYTSKRNRPETKA
jgi:hypothetical protein